MAADARVLMALFEGQEITGLARAARVARRLARAQRGELRVAYFHRIPPGREDRRGRIIVETDREMARIEREVVTAVRDTARGIEGDIVDCVVRFGRAVRELDVELDVYAAGTLVLLAPASLSERWRIWRVRRRLARRPHVRVVVLDVVDESRLSRGRRLAPMGHGA